MTYLFADLGPNATTVLCFAEVVFLIAFIVLVIDRNARHARRVNNEHELKRQERNVK